MTNPLIEKAAEILRENDRGHFTVPSKGLYPFQWNWDSCLTALGQARLDESRAWTEIETLFAHQWEDGFVPHIVFHEPDDGYFPGPDVWQTGRRIPTSGITQPPVAGFTVARLVDRARDGAMARRRAAALLPRSRHGTTGSGAAATLMEPASSRSFIPGNRGATIPSTGTRHSPPSRPGT